MSVEHASAATVAASSSAIAMAPLLTGGWTRMLDAGLAIARAHDGWTFVVLPAPIAAAAGVIAAWPHAPAVAWTSPELTIVGIGCARELRGHGAARWHDVIAGAEAVARGRAVVGGELRARGVVDPLARPRFLGGAAFAIGTADHAPWAGFGDAWFVLPRWTYVHDGTRAFLVLAIDRTAATDAARWHAELALQRAAVGSRFVARAQPPVVELAHGDAAAWHAHLDAIVDAIADGHYEKVVAAHRTEVAFAGEVRAADVFASLDERHPESVRVMVRPPDSGALIAATPERLVTKAGAHVACDALAGSIARRDDGDHTAPPFGAADGRRQALTVDHTAPPFGAADGRRQAPPGAHTAPPVGGAAELLASDKDRREHELVVRAFADGLGARGAVSMPPTPAVRVLRHVVHLHTPIRATLRAPAHVLELVARLHPTPAVGGTPQADAVAWIAAHEPAARGWYAGPVGWFDRAGDGELVVAIRSAVLAGDRAHLWAGAGIVAGSDPARELAETEIKLRTMLGALGAGA